MKPYFLIGAGGHAKAIAELISAAGGEITAYAAPTDSDWLSAKRYSDDDAPEGAGFALALGIGGVTPAQLMRRLQLFGDWRGRGFESPPLLHTRAVISRTAEIGAGTVVLAGAVTQPSARIGAAVILNTRAVIEHDAIVGDGAHVAPGAIVLAGARVGSSAMIGANAVVLAGAVVADGVLVKAATRYPR